MVASDPTLALRWSAGHRRRARAARRRDTIERVSEPSGNDEVLPEAAADDSDVGWGEVPEAPDGDRDIERYLRERPPHHGD